MPDHAKMWDAVDEIVAQAPDTAALRCHRLELLAARRQHALGQVVDPELREAQRAAAIRTVAVPYLLASIRSLLDGTLVLMKGPEAAASYRFPDCRPFKDLDILTANAEAAQSALLQAGFVALPGGAEHHLPPLVLPGVPLAVELHQAPHYIPGLPVPPTEDLLQLTHPSRTGVAGIHGLIPEAHAVLLAAHGWAHGPLERLGDLIDVAALLADGRRARADALAEAWGCGRLWRATTTAIDALLLDRGAPLSLRTWARHLTSTREPRVLETYLARMLAPIWSLPPSGALGRVGAELLRTTLPYEEESWSDQLSRSRRALARTFRPVSEYRTRTTLEESDDLVSARA
jgi:hypothetical protein